HARLGYLCRQNGAAQIHLRNQPPAEDVAVAICVLRHRDGLDHELASRLVLHCPQNNTTLPGGSSIPCSMPKLCAFGAILSIARRSARSTYKILTSPPQ